MSVRLAGLAKLYDGSVHRDEEEFFANSILEALNINGHKKELNVGSDNLKKLTDAFHSAVGGERKIPMIKFVRTLTGWGLKEAKEWVEANIDDYRIRPVY
jgi:ribosomal protein L7/L12